MRQSESFNSDLLPDGVKSVLDELPHGREVRSIELGSCEERREPVGVGLKRTRDVLISSIERFDLAMQRSGQRPLVWQRALETRHHVKEALVGDTSSETQLRFDLVGRYLDCALDLRVRTPR